MPYKVFILIFISSSFLGLRSAAAQQSDSVSVPAQQAVDSKSSTTVAKIDKTKATDSIVNLPTPISISPQKTALYSAVVPGLGQVYNRHYWKVPVIYAAAGVAVYFLYDNSVNYNKYRRMYSGYLSNDPTALADMEQANLSPEYVKYLQDYHRRYLDVTVLVTALGYTVQVLDAAIFAHLKGFDISDDISMRFQPVSYPSNGIGFGLVMRF